LRGSGGGTPYYISPEQVLGEEVDGRSDLYSVGAVMYRALTGDYPFEATTPMAMFTKHLTEDPPSAAADKPDLDIPHVISEAARRCMAKDKADRFQNIEELRDLIVNVLEVGDMPKAERVWLGVDSDHGNRLTAADITSTEPFGQRIATREELENYERKLRRTRYGAYVMLLVLVVAVAMAALYGVRQTVKAFNGFEEEPNDSRAQPNALPLTREIRGRLGKRIDAKTGDRDFFRFVVPGDENDVQFIRFAVSALPNIAMCSFLFRAGYRDTVARFCVGRAGQDLVVPATRITGGEYYLALVQDMEARSGEAFVYENVSDNYRLRVETVTPVAGDEVEPNDREQMAQLVTPGVEMVGTLPWRGDEDVYCAPSKLAEKLRWTLSDEPRPAGTVIELTPLASGTPGPLMRVHGPKMKPFGRMRLPADVNAPYTSPPYPTDHGERCVRLRLTSDPWVRQDARFRLHPNGAKYRLKLSVEGP
jgi:serine/threonine-protein kinase